MDPAQQINQKEIKLFIISNADCAWAMGENSSFIN